MAGKSRASGSDADFEFGYRDDQATAITPEAVQPPLPPNDPPPAPRYKAPRSPEWSMMGVAAAGSLLTSTVLRYANRKWNGNGKDKKQSSEPEAERKGMGPRSYDAARLSAVNVTNTDRFDAASVCEDEPYELYGEPTGAQPVYFSDPPRAAQQANDFDDRWAGASCPLPLRAQTELAANAAEDRRYVEEHQQSQPSWIADLASTTLSAGFAAWAASFRSGLNAKGGSQSKYKPQSTWARDKAFMGSEADSDPAKRQAGGKEEHAQSTRKGRKRQRCKDCKPGAWTLIKHSFSDFSADKAPRLAAAVAYYTVFSIAPLLVIAIAIAGLVYGGDAAAQQQLQTRLSESVGETGTNAIMSMLEGAKKPGAGLIATALSIGALIFGASGVFTQLKDALNTIWEVQQQGGGIKSTIFARLKSFLLVAAIAVLLLASMILSTTLTAVSSYIEFDIPGLSILMHVANAVISLGVLTLLFAMVYKYLPDVEITWKDVLLGSVVTAFLFLLGNYAIGLYFSHTAVGSSYGAAGSVMIVLLWANYSAMIFFLGAEFTQAYAMMYGSQIQPAANAKFVEKNP